MRVRTYRTRTKRYGNTETLAPTSTSIGDYARWWRNSLPRPSSKIETNWRAAARLKLSGPPSLTPFPFFAIRRTVRYGTVRDGHFPGNQSRPRWKRTVAPLAALLCRHRRAARCAAVRLWRPRRCLPFETFSPPRPRTAKMLSSFGALIVRPLWGPVAVAGRRGDGSVNSADVYGGVSEFWPAN